MLRPIWQKCLLLATLVVAGVMLSASPAQAGWWHWRAGWYGYSYGYYPAYGYTTSYYRPYVSGYGWYPSWYAGCYAGCYNPCYSYGCGSCCGVVTSCCDAQVVEPMAGAGTAPRAASPPEPMPPEPMPEPSSLLPSPPRSKTVPAAPDVDLPRLQDMPVLPPAPGDPGKPSAKRDVPPNAALLTIAVPQDAQVYVNGMLTKTPGAQRQYVSYGLQPGYSYTYEVQAVVIRNGQRLSDTQVVRIRVGDAHDLAFDFAARADEVIASRLR